MRKFKIQHLLKIVTVVVLSSCAKQLDINTDPNTATTVKPDLLFNFAFSSWSANRTGGDSYIPFALSTQTQASGGNYGGLGKSDVYDVSPFSTNNTWRGYYATSGNNFILAIRQAESSSPVNNNAAAQCKILLANMMFECTTIWGDIPFSEAWKDNISNPKFDTQKDVFEELLSLLDQAIAQIDDASPLKIDNYDLAYNGDMVKWKKFARSLKFKILMTMVDKDPSKATAISQLLMEDGMVSSADDNLEYPYSTESGKENPKYGVIKNFGGGTNIFFYANNNVFKYMQPLNDPRIPVYFEKGPAATTFQAVETEADANDNTATINVHTLMRADAPDVIYTYQEQLFLEAEAYARGLGMPADLTKADGKYRAAISAAMAYYGVDGTAYLALLPSLTVAPNPVQEIHKQQWIDLVDRPLEAFLQWRRSGPEGSEFPPLLQPPGTPDGGFLRRWDYPQTAEILVNANAPKDVIPFTTKLWFDQ